MIPLFGHEAAVAQFRAALDSGRLHHAWLIAGPEGIGKRTFADSAALRLLADGAGLALYGPGLEVPDDHPAARLAAAGSHPDLLVLEREVREGGTELARNITVHQARRLHRLFSLMPTYSDRRAVIIDSVDDMERSAANSLLKHLEEPPAGAVFFLVSHSPERLPPTIRSRCRVLRLAPLENDAMTSALRAALPDAREEEIARLVAAGEGAPGRALAWRGLDIDALDSELAELARLGDPTNARRAALAQSLSLKSAQPRYEAFLVRAPAAIAAAAKQRRGRRLGEAVALWEQASALAGSARRLSLDPQSTAFELAGLVAALADRAADRAA